MCRDITAKMTETLKSMAKNHCSHLQEHPRKVDKLSAGRHHLPRTTMNQRRRGDQIIYRADAMHSRENMEGETEHEASADDRVKAREEGVPLPPRRRRSKKVITGPLPAVKG